MLSCPKRLIEEDYKARAGECSPSRASQGSFLQGHKHLRQTGINVITTALLSNCANLQKGCARDAGVLWLLPFLIKLMTSQSCYRAMKICAASMVPGVSLTPARVTEPPGPPLPSTSFPCSSHYFISITVAALLLTNSESLKY